MEVVSGYIIDVVLILIFGINVYIYYKKSFVKTVLEFFSFFAAAFLAKMFSEKAADYIIANTSLFQGDSGKAKATLVLIVVMFILLSALFKTLISYVDKSLKVPIINSANKMLGMCLGVLIGFLVVGACVALIAMLELSGYEPLIKMADSSGIMKFYSEVIVKCYPHVAEIIEKGV